MPEYHPVYYPFYISKSLRSIKLINFRDMKVFTLIETPDMPTDCYGYKKLTLAKTHDGRIKIVFVTSENQNTIVQEVSFAANFKKALELTGEQEAHTVEQNDLQSSPTRDAQTTQINTH